MELKLPSNMEVLLSAPSFNRTFMELKYIKDAEGLKAVKF